MGHLLGGKEKRSFKNRNIHVVRFYLPVRALFLEKLP